MLYFTCHIVENPVATQANMFQTCCAAWSCDADHANSYTALTFGTTISLLTHDKHPSHLLTRIFIIGLHHELPLAPSQC